MTRLFSSARLRWAVPALVAAAVAGAAITTSGGGAGAAERPKLPPKSAAELLAAVQQAHPTSLAGTIVETAHLGLPNLPSSGISSGGDNLSFQSLLTGSHTMKVWYAGPTKQRLALLAPLSERDVVHNGTDLWIYTSTTNEVEHRAVKRNAPVVSQDLIGLTPQQAAKQALQKVGPTTVVSVDDTARVAGQATYQIVLTPRDSRSLVSSVRIAIDAATSVPLRVQLFGASSSSTPAIEVGFTDISYSAVSPSVFNFVTPPGATAKQDSGDSSTKPSPGGDRVTPTPSTGEAPSTGRVPSRGHSSTSGQEPPTGTDNTLGSGWTAVKEMPYELSYDQTGHLFWQLSKAVPGGRLITSSLISVLLTNDGRIFMGPVSGAAIQQVAATGKGL